MFLCSPNKKNLWLNHIKKTPHLCEVMLLLQKAPGSDVLLTSLRRGDRQPPKPQPEPQRLSR